jgi:hypothetical protein
LYFPDFEGQGLFSVLEAAYAFGRVLTMENEKAEVIMKE